MLYLGHVGGNGDGDVRQKNGRLLAGHQRTGELSGANPLSGDQRVEDRPLEVDVEHYLAVVFFCGGVVRNRFFYKKGEDFF